MQTVHKSLLITSIINTWSLVRRATPFVWRVTSQSLCLSFACAERRAAQAEGNGSHVDYLLAGNEKTSGKKLEFLARSKSYRVRERVAENPNCPAAVLQRLSRDPDADVRVGVSQNPNAPHKLLKQLSEDICLDVPFGMAENHALPSSILYTLSKHANPFISDRAQRALERKQLAVCIDSHSTKITDRVYWCLLPAHKLQMTA